MALAGGVGLVLGAAIFLGAQRFSAILPALIRGTEGIVVLFGLLLTIALGEIPVMLFGLRQLGSHATMPRGFALTAYAGYVAFAWVYASVMVLVTGAEALAWTIGATSFFRFFSGIWLK